MADTAVAGISVSQHGPPACALDFNVISTRRRTVADRCVQGGVGIRTGLNGPGAVLQLQKNVEIRGDGGRVGIDSHRSGAADGENVEIDIVVSRDNSHLVNQTTRHTQSRSGAA